MNQDKRLPVTVISGFLGAGKTTLLKRILTNLEGLRVGLIVNDMSEINIDAELVRDAVHQVDAQLVEMTNGCICCTLRADLLEQVARLAREGQLDYLVIESTGISEPLPVAATFSFEDESGFSLGQLARLDTMVTLVDAASFFDYYFSSRDLTDMSVGAEAGDTRSLVDLLADQIEFADVLLLNKTDLVQPGDVQAIQDILRKLNPAARLYTSQFSDIPLAQILNTGLFDPAKASQMIGWSQELVALNNPEHRPETEEYGISSFVYRARRPFHPERLFQSLDRAPDGLVRVKGFFWMASQNDTVGFWSQAGSSLRLEAKGRWWAATPQELWPKEQEFLDWTQSRWQEPYGDRRQELVAIGLELSATAVSAFFDAALLTDAEMSQGPSHWATLSDPFPPWGLVPAPEPVAALPC